MGIPYDPQEALVSDWRTFCLDHRDELFTIPCEEGPVEMNGRFLLLNLMLCMPLITRRRPISRDKHLFLGGIYDAAEHARLLDEVKVSLERYGYTREELGHDIIMTVNDSFNMCYTHLGSYIKTMDIFSIADTILQPGVKELTTMDWGDIEDGNMHRMETAFKDRCKEVDALLSGDTLEYNVFRTPLVCGALKRGQFHQFVLAAGPRTDTDDHIFLRPVIGSFLSGMVDIKDLAIESRSASKAKHYNKTQMPTTQYQNRKVHIQNSAIRYLYPGDCGTDVYLTYQIAPKHVEFFVGKFYLTPGGVLQELTEERFPEVIGHAVKFRDVPGCRYTDGYCEVCGGTITRSFSRLGNVGFLSNVNTGAPVAQQVLSTKHLISTDAAEYEVPEVLEYLLYSKANDIFLRKEHHRKIGSLALGFHANDVSKLNDLRYYLSDNELNAAYFTSLKYLSIGRVNPDGSIAKPPSRTPLGGESKTYPHLSPEILKIIRDHPEDIVSQGGIEWILLRNIDVEAPIMQCTVVNNSIKKFVNRFSQMVTKDVERYTSVNDFMRDLTGLIWERVGTHVTHVSCLVRACMITSKKDFHVPQITDPDNVMFGTLGRIIPMRSVGGLLAFERYHMATNKPITYITPKRHGIFDEFVGYSDIIERDREWPVLTGSVVEEEQA